MEMTADQGFHLAIIIAIAVLLTIVYFVPNEKRPSVAVVFWGGLGCAIFGAATHMLVGNSLKAMLILEDTGGFGRAYVVGLGIITSGFFIGLAKTLTHKRDQ